MPTGQRFREGNTPGVILIPLIEIVSVLAGRILAQKDYSAKG